MLVNKLCIIWLGLACLTTQANAQVASTAARHQFIPEVAALTSQRSAHFESLRSLVQKHGRVPIIVQFDSFDSPLPRLSEDEQNQRMIHIQDRGKQILEELARQGQIHNVKRFQYSPHLAITVNENALFGLEHNPNILDAVEDSVVKPTLGETTQLLQLGSAAWNMGDTGSGLSVAILDTGVDSTHPFLSGKIVSEACYSTTNSTYGATSLCPGGTNSTAKGSGLNCSGISGCDHGTHVAGIAAGKDYAGGPGFNGVAPDAKLIAIQIFSRFDNATYCGSSTPCIMSFTSDQMLALERVYALSSQLSIASANLSLSGGRYYSQCDSNNTGMKYDIDNLRAVEIATVIAAGNDSYTDSISAPACISSAISVGSTCDSTNYYCPGVDAVASYSNIASFLSLLAPGSAVTSSIPGGGFATWHGTSMATPHVAGAWAIKKQQQPTATVDTVLQDFKNTGVTINDTRTGGTVSGMKRILFVANRPPVAVNDAFTGTAGASLIVGAPGVLANDSDPDGNPITAIQSSAPNFGGLTLNSNGSFSYTPNTGFTGIDSFNYYVSDGALTSSIATVTITINGASLPSAPSGLAATAQPNLNIKLTWTDNANNENGFLIERSTNLTSWSQIGTTSANITTYTASGLKSGVKYYFRVRAYNNTGNSNYSNIASAQAKR